MVFVRGYGACSRLWSLFGIIFQDLVVVQDVIVNIHFAYTF